MTAKNTDQEHTTTEASARSPQSMGRQRRIPRWLLCYVGLTLVGAIVVTMWLWRTPAGKSRFLREVFTDPQLRLVYLGYWCFGLGVVYFLVNLKRLWKSVLGIGGISAVLFFVMLELVGRLMLPSADVPTLPECGLASRKLHHVLLPDTEMVWDHARYSHVKIRTNNDGLRTPYSRAGFLQKDTRIAVLGDSYTFGFMVNEEDSIPGHLEIMLRKQTERPSSVAVLNAGLVSYAPLIERQQFEDIVQHYRPQLTILPLHSNEIANNYQYVQENKGSWDDLHFPYPESWTTLEQKPWEQSISLQLLRATRVLHPLQSLGDALGLETADETQIQRYDYKGFKVEIDGKIETSHFFPMRYTTERLKPYYDETWRQLLAINERCEAIGSKFLLVLLPFGFHYDLNEAPRDLGRINQEYDGSEPFRFAFFDEMTRRGAADGLTVVNLLPVFQATDERPLCFVDDLHYNADGNQVAAKAIAEYILSNNLIDLTPTD